MAERTLGVTLTKTMSGDETEDLVIGSLTNIGELKIDGEEIEVTTLDSDGGYREYIPGFRDAGEISLEGILNDDETLSKLIALQGTGSIEEYTIETTSGATLVFNAFVKSAGHTAFEIDGVRGYTGTLRISGAPVFTGVSASA